MRAPRPNINNFNDKGLSNALKRYILVVMLIIQPDKATQVNSVPIVIIVTPAYLNRYLNFQPLHLSISINKAIDNIIKITREIVENGI